MQVSIAKDFPIAAPATAAWECLQDIPSVAGCIPGASITGQIDASHYRGQLSIKLGPATAQFGGKIEIRTIDAGRREIRITGQGADSKGSSAASLDLTASVREAAAGCELIGIAEVSVSGKLASFGARLMTQVAEQLVKQFGEAFAALVAAHLVVQTAAMTAAPPTKKPPPAAPVAVTSPVVVASPVAVAPAVAVARPVAPSPLNALALIRATLAGFVKSLFTRRAKPDRPA